MSNLSRQQSGQPLLSKFKDATGSTQPSLSENPPVLTSADPLFLPSAESAESTHPVTTSTPEQLQNMPTDGKVDLELLAQILKTTVENLEAAGMCWRTKTKNVGGEYLRIVLPLGLWTTDMELKVLAKNEKD